MTRRRLPVVAVPVPVPDQHNALLSLTQSKQVWTGSGSWFRCLLASEIRQKGRISEAEGASRYLL